MAESLESRKNERKATFDVPLPMRRKDRDTSAANEWGDEGVDADARPSSTMAFSLLTKRGNRQQVRVLHKRIPTLLISRRLAQLNFHQIPHLQLP